MRGERCPDCAWTTRFHTAELCPERREHFVYRVFSAENELIYIGCTVDPWGRWASHRTQSQWFDMASRIDWTPYPSQSVALAAEAAAIKAEAPAFNKKHNGNNRPSTPSTVFMVFEQFAHMAAAS